MSNEEEDRQLQFWCNTLGVAADATEKQIKAAYKRKAKLLHPDKNRPNKTGDAKVDEVEKKRVETEFNWVSDAHVGLLKRLRNKPILAQHTPLMTAIRLQDPDAVAAIIGASDFNAEVFATQEAGKHGFSPLHQAVFTLSQELSLGRDISKSDAIVDMILSSPHFDSSMLLIRLHSTGSNPLLCAISESEIHNGGNPYIVKKILASSACTEDVLVQACNNGWNALYSTIKAIESPVSFYRGTEIFSKYELFNTIIASPLCSERVLMSQSTIMGMTAVHQLVALAELPSLKELLASSSCTENVLLQVDAYGNTALHCAANTNNVENFKALLVVPSCTMAFVMAKDKSNRTALEIVADHRAESTYTLTQTVLRDSLIEEIDVLSHEMMATKNNADLMLPFATSVQQLPLRTMSMENLVVVYRLVKSAKTFAQNTEITDQNFNLFLSSIEEAKQIKPQWGSTLVDGMLFIAASVALVMSVTIGVMALGFNIPILAVMGFAATASTKTAVSAFAVASVSALATGYSLHRFFQPRVDNMAVLVAAADDVQNAFVI